MKQARTFKFIATVEEDMIHKIKTIASKLKKEGVVVDQVMEMSGIITGSISNMKDLNQFKSIGIKSFETNKQKKAW